MTIFTAGGVKTLPIWIFQSFRLANQVPVVNVAGVVAILLSAIPVYIATRIASDSGWLTGRRLRVRPDARSTIASCRHRPPPGRARMVPTITSAMTASSRTHSGPPSGEGARRAS